MATVRRASFGRRLAQACMAAAAGSFLGQQYAVAHVPAHVLEGSHLAGMYATGGAVVAVLALRLGTLLWAMGREFLGRR